MAEHSEFTRWLASQADRGDAVGRLGHDVATVGIEGAYASLSDPATRQAVRQAQEEWAELERARGSL